MEQLGVLARPITSRSCGSNPTPATYELKEESTMKRILKFPFSRQCYNYDCGANAMQSILDYYGIDLGEGEIMKIAHTTKSGTSFAGLKKVADKFKLKYKQKVMTVDEIKRNIDKKGRQS